MIKNSNVVIFGYPRSGTKLLANVLEQQGYLNFGEFFETFATEIPDNSPKAVRIPVENQIEIFKKLQANYYAEMHKHALEVSKRVTTFNTYDNTDRSTITLFTHSLALAPELFDILLSRYFLCLKRKNKFEQLLSRTITYNSKNYDTEAPSARLTIDLWQFERFFFQLKEADRLQDYLVSCNRGMIVDFDELITGASDLGFTYNVTSKDEHEDLPSFVINYDAVLAKFNYLNSLYK
jgi:hypothetical protein